MTGSQGERYAYRYMASKAVLGPERDPVVALWDEEYTGLYQQLDALNFFNQTPPTYKWFKQYNTIQYRSHKLRDLFDNY